MSQEKLTFGYKTKDWNVPGLMNLEPGETTNLVFLVGEGLTADDLLAYFVRFAIAAGWQQGSVDDAIIAYAHEVEDSELQSKYKEYEEDNEKFNLTGDGNPQCKSEDINNEA